MSTVDVSSLAAPSPQTEAVIDSSCILTSSSSADVVPVSAVSAPSVRASPHFEERCEAVRAAFSGRETRGFCARSSSADCSSSSVPGVTGNSGEHVPADEALTGTQFLTSGPEVGRQDTPGEERCLGSVEGLSGGGERQRPVRKWTERNGQTERRRSRRHRRTGIGRGNLRRKESALQQHAGGGGERRGKFVCAVSLESGVTLQSSKVARGESSADCFVEQEKRCGGNRGGEDTRKEEEEEEGGLRSRGTTGEQARKRDQAEAGEANAGQGRRVGQSRTGSRGKAGDGGVSEWESHGYAPFRSGSRTRDRERQEEEEQEQLTLLGGEERQNNYSFPLVERWWMKAEPLLLGVGHLEKQTLSNWESGRGDWEGKENKGRRKDLLVSAAVDYGAKQWKTGRRRRHRVGQNTEEKEDRPPVTLLEKSRFRGSPSAMDLVSASGAQELCSSALPRKASTAAERETGSQPRPGVSRATDPQNLSPSGAKKPRTSHFSAPVCFPSCPPSAASLGQSAQVGERRGGCFQEGTDNGQSAAGAPAQQHAVARLQAATDASCALEDSSSPRSIPVGCPGEKGRGRALHAEQEKKRQQVDLRQKSFLSSCSQCGLLARERPGAGGDVRERDSTRLPEREESLLTFSGEEGVEPSEENNRPAKQPDLTVAPGPVPPGDCGEKWRPRVSCVSVSRQHTLGKHAVVTSLQGRNCSSFLSASAFSAQSQTSGTGAVEVSRSLRRELTCSICLEVLQLPVTVDCGHTFCRYCIARSRLTRLVCPLCRQALRPIPALAINTVLANLLSLLGLRKNNFAQFSPTKYLEATGTQLGTSRRKTGGTPPPCSLQGASHATVDATEGTATDTEDSRHGDPVLGGGKAEGGERERAEPTKLRLPENWWKEKSLKPKVAMTLALRLFLSELGQESVVFFDDLVGAVVEVFDREKLWSHSKWIFSQQDLETFCRLVQFDPDERGGSLARLRTWVEECVSALPRVGARRYLADPVTGGERHVFLRVLPDKQHKVEGRVFDSISIQHSLPWDLGRHHRALLHIPHSSVSLSHLQLVRQGTENDLAVVDLGSTIGTMQRVSGTYTLKSEDVIHFGDHIEVTVEIIPARVVKRLERRRRRQQRKSRRDRANKSRVEGSVVACDGDMRTSAKAPSSSVLSEGGQQCDEELWGRAGPSPSLAREDRLPRHGGVPPCSGTETAAAKEGAPGEAVPVSETTGYPEGTEDLRGFEALPPNPFIGVRWSNSLQSCIMASRRAPAERGQERRRLFGPMTRRGREVEETSQLGVFRHLGPGRSSRVGRCLNTEVQESLDKRLEGSGDASEDRQSPDESSSFDVGGGLHVNSWPQAVRLPGSPHTASHQLDEGGNAGCSKTEAEPRESGREAENPNCCLDQTFSDTFPKRDALRSSRARGGRIHGHARGKDGEEKLSAPSSAQRASYALGQGSSRQSEPVEGLADCSVAPFSSQEVSSSGGAASNPSRLPDSAARKREAGCRGAAAKKRPTSSPTLLEEGLPAVAGCFEGKEEWRQETGPGSSQSRRPGFRREATDRRADDARSFDEQKASEQRPANPGVLAGPQLVGLREGRPDFSCSAGGRGGGGVAEVAAVLSVPGSPGPAHNAKPSRNLSPCSRAVVLTQGSEDIPLGEVPEVFPRSPAVVQIPFKQNRVRGLVLQAVRDGQGVAAFVAEEGGRGPERSVAGPPSQLSRSAERDRQSGSPASQGEGGVPMSGSSRGHQAPEGHVQSGTCKARPPRCAPAARELIQGEDDFRMAGLPGVANLDASETREKTEAAHRSPHTRSQYGLGTGEQREVGCDLHVGRPPAYGMNKRRPPSFRFSESAGESGGRENLRAQDSFAEVISPAGLEGEQDASFSGDSGYSSSDEKDEHAEDDRLRPRELEDLESYALLRLRCKGEILGGGSSGNASVVNPRPGETAGISAAAHDSHSGRRYEGKGTREAVAVAEREDGDASLQAVEEPEVVGPRVEWIPPSGLVLGRGPYNPHPGLRKIAVTMRNGYVSRLHCTIFYDGSRPRDQRWVLKDTSTLGTYIRVKPFVPHTCPLDPTCVLKVGQCKLEIALRGSAASSALSVPAGVPTPPDNGAIPGDGPANGAAVSQIPQQRSFAPRDHAPSSFSSSSPSCHLSPQRFLRLPGSEAEVSQHANASAASPAPSGHVPPVPTHHASDTTRPYFPGMPTILLRSPALVTQQRTADCDTADAHATVPVAGSWGRLARSSRSRGSYLQRLGSREGDSVLGSETAELLGRMSHQARGTAIAGAAAAAAVSQTRWVPALAGAGVFEQLDQEISRLQQRFVASLRAGVIDEVEKREHGTRSADSPMAANGRRTGAVENAQRNGTTGNDSGMVGGSAAGLQTAKDCPCLQSCAYMEGSQDVPGHSPRGRAGTTADCTNDVLGTSGRHSDRLGSEE